MNKQPHRLVLVIGTPEALANLANHGADMVQRDMDFLAEVMLPRASLFQEPRRPSFPKPPRVIKPTKSWYLGRR
jgi:hypothetical protein